MRSLYSIGATVAQPLTFTQLRERALGEAKKNPFPNVVSYVFADGSVGSGGFASSQEAGDRYGILTNEPGEIQYIMLWSRDGNYENGVRDEAMYQVTTNTVVQTKTKTPWGWIAGGAAGLLGLIALGRK